MTQTSGNLATPFDVLIIDGRPASRAGLRMVLETEPGVCVVGEAHTLAEGLRCAEHTRPHAIVLDLEVAGTDATNLTRQLAVEFPTCVVMLVALLLDPATQAELISAGAAACVEKDLPGNFLKAFRKIRQRSSQTS